MTNGEATPSTIGRYQVLRTLGEGGMGSVFLATDPAIDRLVALKLMRAGFDAGQLRERFAREAKAVGRLHHPNIVTIFEYGEHQGEPFIAMEYVEGQTLSSLAGRPDVSLPQVLALMDGLCAGLHYAHRAGIIHRDIKPVNVMVDGEGIVKILDFGIARAAAMSLTQAGTQPGTILGTLNYMSPEQLSGKPVDQRTDIFAVGAVFYELLTGRMAFPGDLQSGVLQLILMTGPAPIESVRPDLDPAIVAIINRCLERDVERRYPDLGVMRQDLAAVRHLESTPRSAGATVMLTPSMSPASVNLVGLKTPGPDTRGAAERARHAQYDVQVNDARDALQREEYTRATDALQQVLRAEPTHPGALALRAELESVRQARELLADGQREFDRGALTGATQLVDRALAARPAMPEALKLRAAIEDAKARGHQASAATVLINPSAQAGSAETVLLKPQQAAEATFIAPPPPPAAPSSGAHSAPASSPVAAALSSTLEEPKRSPVKFWGSVAAAAVVLAAVIGVFVLLKKPVPADVVKSADSAPSGAPIETAPAPDATPTPAPPVAAASSSDEGTTTPLPLPAATPPPAPPPTASAPTKPAASPTPAPVVSKPAAAPSAAPPVEPPASGPPATTAPLASGASSSAPPESGAALPLRGNGRACTNGNAHACTEAGLAYRNGRGVNRDDTTAAAFFLRGCDGNDSFACVYLGQLTLMGSGVGKNELGAATLYQKGCDGGAPIGCFYLGNMYQNGRSVPRDEPKAFTLFARGCEGNNFAACNEAALAISGGQSGVPRNDPRTVSFLKKACDGDYPLGCRNLGVLYEEGRGVPKNEQIALGMFQKACDAHIGVACTNIGQMFEQGRGVPKSDAEAKTFFGKACDAGDQNGCRLKGGGH